MGFKTLSVKTKLVLAFLLMCVLTCAVGVIGLTSGAALNAQFAALWGRDVAAMDELLQAELEFARVGRELRQMVIETDEAEMRTQQRAVEQHLVDLRRNLDNAEPHILLPENRETMRSVREDLGPYIDIIRRIEDLALKNDNRNATLELRAGRALGQKLGGQLDSLVRGKRRFGLDSMHAAADEYARARTFSLAVLVASLGIGIVLAIAFSRWFGKALLDVRRVAKTLTEAAGELAAASEDIASGAQEQAASLEETASSLEELTSTVRHNAENATQASQLAGSSRDTADRGGGAVRSAVEAMADVNKSSKRIADIITTIDEIAFQTNLLALNAAVEAARAGEQGRGFAVVAAEVRNLAQRTTQAAKEIKGLIEDSLEKVEGAFGLVQRSGNVLQEIVVSVKRVTDFVGEIAAASREQAAGLEQANTAITQMDSVTQSNAAQTEEMAATAQSLAQQAEHLGSVVAQFHLAPEAESSFELRRDNVASRPRAVAASSGGRDRAVRSRTQPAARSLLLGSTRSQEAAQGMDASSVDVDSAPSAQASIREY